jgi:hypothetical protein
MAFLGIRQLKFGCDIPAGPKRSRQPIEKMTGYNIWNRSGRWSAARAAHGKDGCATTGQILVSAHNDLSKHVFVKMASDAKVEVRACAPLEI